MMHLKRTILALTSALALTAAAGAADAQATASQAPAADAGGSGYAYDPARVDPYEGLNRKLFLVGGAIDIVVIRPVAIFYKRITPRPAREGLHNVLENISEPGNFVNHMLQLRPKPAAITFGRFAMNTTLGIGGLFDVASRAGLPEKDTDFGLTLSRYGVRQGPYIYLPVLGPSTVRDSTGRIADIFLDPINYLRFGGDGYFFGSRTVAEGLDQRVRADPALLYIQKTSTDPYAALRSAYLQNARSLARGGKLDVKDLPNFGPEPSAPAASPPPGAPKTPTPQ
jgi:phospholipid-binding lipoprotein MlaA